MRMRPGPRNWFWTCPATSRRRWQSQFGWIIHEGQAGMRPTCPFHIAQSAYILDPLKRRTSGLVIVPLSATHLQPVRQSTAFQQRAWLPARWQVEWDADTSCLQGHLGRSPRKILSEKSQLRIERRLLLLLPVFSFAVLSLPVFAQQVIATIPVGSYPQSAAVNPVSNKIYVANNTCGDMPPCPNPGTVLGNRRVDHRLRRCGVRSRRRGGQPDDDGEQYLRRKSMRQRSHLREQWHRDRH